MEYKRDQKREFTVDVKRGEKIAANYQCRICGAKKSQCPLECAHIYTLTKTDAWQRSSKSNKDKDDEYVKSIDNCLLLCKFHHERIDSPEGLKRCTVEYLESLKKDVTSCTALVRDGDSWRRCKAKNSRGDCSGSYRCKNHINGGLENTLPKRTFTPSMNKKNNKKSQKQGQKQGQTSSWGCIIC